MARRNMNEKGVKHPSLGGTIVKAVFGVLFVVVGFPSSGEPFDLTLFLTGLVIGAGLLAWAVLPWLRYKKAEQERREAEQAVIRRAEAKAEQEALRPWRCPSCGATTQGALCEYCGSKP